VGLRRDAELRTIPICSRHPVKEARPSCGGVDRRGRQVASAVGHGGAEAEALQRRALLVHERLKEDARGNVLRIAQLVVEGGAAVVQRAIQACELAADTAFQSLAVTHHANVTVRSEDVGDRSLDEDQVARRLEALQAERALELSELNGGLAE